jgi:hypothetical protein
MLTSINISGGGIVLAGCYIALASAIAGVALFSRVPARRRSAMAVLKLRVRVKDDRKRRAPGLDQVHTRHSMSLVILSGQGARGAFSQSAPQFRAGERVPRLTRRYSRRLHSEQPVERPTAALSCGALKTRPHALFGGPTRVGVYGRLHGKGPMNPPGSGTPAPPR